ncbi:Piso0_005482 [Millerozyma farinosa CBS 7064]|uniref:Piso0_005482 protein n=1 Tax=Pichia sorbitophila (strain ATCC MYA-4447 / BCRC 22081 / CBS 7064 / NBRC 10061 / NRRL Y-12695) TaxID=559304 RepID=G8Y578_PICSO|nr:Piso0_005482 [Millerozyma farinosa CBS 7064]
MQTCGIYRRQSFVVVPGARAARIDHFLMGFIYISMHREVCCVPSSSGVGPFKDCTTLASSERSDVEHGIPQSAKQNRGLPCHLDHVAKTIQVSVLTLFLVWTFARISYFPW